MKLDFDVRLIMSSEFGYSDENSTISPAIISKMNLVKKIKKTIYFMREIRYNIYRK